MNITETSTQLLYTTLPIWLEYENGQQGSGTGFIFMYPSKANPQVSIPLLITNYHVLRGARRGLIDFVEREGDAPKRGERVRVEISGNDLQLFNDMQNDLAALPIGPILNQLESSGRGVFFRSITPDLVPASDVLNNLAAIEE